MTEETIQILYLVRIDTGNHLYDELHGLFNSVREAEEFGRSKRKPFLINAITDMRKAAPHLTQKPEVDVADLRQGYPKSGSPETAWSYVDGWNDCIDHLHQRGLIVQGKAGGERDEIQWFVNDTIDDPGLEEFITHTEFSWFRKGGRDRTGKYLIFLMEGDDTIAAIRSNSQKLHCRALEILNTASRDGGE